MIMNRALHKIVLSTLFTLLVNVIFSQSLYWVGGSGNFNDPKHWSLKSGGEPAFLIPNNTIDVFFDDNSGVGYFTVNFDKNNSVKNFRATSLKNGVIFEGSKADVLYISEEIYLAQFVKFNSEAEVIFNSASFKTNRIEFGLNKLKCNLYFNKGNYSFYTIITEENCGMTFGGGKYIFEGAAISTGKFLNTDANATFNFNKALIRASDLFKIDANASVSSNKLYLAAVSAGSKISNEKFAGPAAMLSAPTNTFVNFMMPMCNLTVTTKPACTPCTGVLTISFSPGCTDNPYNISMSGDPSCAATWGTIGGMVNTATTTSFVATNACSCTLNYQLVIFDNATPTANFIIQNVNFIPNTITSSIGTQTLTSCSYLCDGKISANIFGSSPFTVSVLPATVTPNSFTTALPYTLSNLCGGQVYTLNIVDKDGCTGSVTKTLTATPPVLPNSITNSVQCFNACNGTISINPTGGSPGYTVAFGAPISTSYTVAAAGSASASGLCPGAYSSTITDVKGCSVTTNYTITQPTSITVVPTQTNLLCNSVCNGQASVSLSGGTPPYFYSWSPSGSTTNVATALCAGTQTLSILDNNACPRTQTFNITSPPAITITVTGKNISCNSLCNGSATITQTGGVAPHTFTWTGPAPFVTTTGSVITNLCPGVYTVNSKDGNGCTNTRTVNITQPSPATVNVNVVNNTCFSSCAGAATISVSGGNGAPFNYSVSVAATSSIVAGGVLTISNLCAGNFTISATDASLCPSSTVITITQPASITPNITTQTLSCNSVCIGSINAAAAGGSGGPYTYTLFTPIPSTIPGPPPFTNLCAGIYTLAIKDITNCVSNTTINITQPPALVPSVSGSSVTCFNGCNGSLAGSVIGGTPGYTLSWTTATSTIPGGNLTNQCAGNYTFNVVDAKSCTAQATFTLQQPTQITTTFNIVNPTCPNPPGGFNGQITTNVSGGTPGYTLNWSNSGGNPNINLGAGVYTLTVNDANNCIRVFTAAVVAPPSFTVSVATKSTVCAGDCNGSATVTAAGGTGLLTYQLNSPVITNTTGIFTGLCAGAYIVSVTDANGCSTSIGFNISAPPLLNANITGIKNTCNVCTGAATITVSGGVPGYTVNWTNSVSATVGTGTTVANLCLGNYTATVTDANGCVKTATVGIANTVTVAIVTSGSSILCFGVCNASATANPSGGTPPYTYTWSSAPTQTTQTATGLCAGSYTVTVADLAGCSNTAGITFTQPSSITVTSSQTNIPCFASGCVGAITTTVSGGTGPYTYSWSPGSQTTSSLTGLCIGNYTVKITDFNGCTVTPQPTFGIVSNPSLSIAFTSTTPTGCNISNGIISATASGGSGAGYTFTWSPASASVVVGNSTSATGLGAGTYTLFVKDGAGCTNSFVTNLSNPAGPVLTVSSTSINCFGGATGSATASATGTGPFSFTWSPATASTVSSATTTASGLVTGTYNINVTDMATGCITSQSIGILQPTQMTITSNVTNASCNTSNNGSITATVAGGTPNYTLTWTPGAMTGTAVTGLSPQNYTLTVTDLNGCIMTRTFVITAPSSLTVSSTQTNVACNSGTSGAITLTVTGGTAAYTFTWVPVGPFAGSNASSVSGLGQGVYTVNITDANGCPVQRTFTITQPTAFGHTVTTTNAVCNSTCNGTASMVVTGGTPTYSFSWSSTAATTQSVGSLCAGNYTATVTDGNGCVSLKTFTITQPTAIAVTVTPTNPKCNAACNGSIVANVAGGNGGYSYAWVPAGSGASPTGLCAGNYTLTITDASLCLQTAVVTLTNPPLLTSNITFTNPLCNANCNGVAVSTPSNAVAVIQYTWTTVPPQSAATATGLCAGTYSVYISDGNGCTDTGVVTLSNPPLLNVNVSILAASCGSANGTATIVASGGTPTYNFVWTPPVSTTSVATNISAGVYTVVVTDQNGCSNTQSIPVSNTGGPTLAVISQTNVACNSFCTGAASVTTIGGGTPSYSVSWVTPASASTLVTNLCAGTYTAQVKDANNCLFFQSVVITEPPAIDDNEIVTNAFCIGVCSGSITLAPAGGTGTFSYVWSPSTSTTNVATGLCVGVHTTTITDQAGCTFTASYNVNGVTVLTSAIASSSNPCFGNCVGSATVTASGGGLAPYSYQWSNSQNGLIANNLCNGTYSLVVTDNNGCQNTFTTNIGSPAAITIAPSVAQPSCGMCNGSATVATGGGISPFTYSWTSSATNTTNTESNLCAGLYQVQVTDANGCTQIQNIPISSSTTMTETYNVQDELCANSCNGQVTVTPSGGTSPYTFNWINPVSTNSVLGSLCGGIYFVQITDAQGCVRTSSVTVNSATVITVNTSVQSPSCGPGNGTITATATGGSGTYTMTWLPAGSGTTITGPAGIYTLSVFDGTCTQTAVVNMNNSTAPALFYTVTNNGCSTGPCTGSIVVTPTLGTAQYDYVWSNGSSALSLPSHSVTGLCAGVITLTVTDAAGCKAFQTFTITQNPVLNLSLPVITAIKCNNDCNGAIQLVPSGGVLPYTITWIPASTVTPSNPNTNLCAGSYTGIVTDANGCILTRTVDILNPLPFTFTSQVTDATCNTSQDGAISTTVTGATPVYTYTWTDPTSATFTTASLSNLNPGTYTLDVIDSQGCPLNTTVTVNSGFTVVANANPDMTLCIDPSTPIVLDGTSSTNGVNYTWSVITPTVNIANTPSTSVTPAVGTNSYVLLVTSSLVICYDTEMVVINVNPLPSADAGPTQTISLFTQATLGGAPTSITGTSFTWTPSADLSNPNASNPVTSTTVNTQYTVFVLDPNTGCVNTSTVDIFIYPDVKIPNGFSPNSDGKNDVWVIDNIQQFTECIVEVYNRWGELLFQSAPGYPKPWDGIYHGKPVPVGTYYYIIDLKHVAYPKPYTGPLTIFR